jgi:ABC transporter substrate binding protein
MHAIGRRALIVGAGALSTAPLVGYAQSADIVRRIGLLSSETADSEGGQLVQKLIPEALKQRGWTEGGNLVIEWRWANGKTADLPELAAQPDDVPVMLNAIAASGIKAMFYQGDPIVRTRTEEIMVFLRDHRMASVAPIPTFAEAGGLAHYAPDGRNFYDRTASFVDRILRGAKPSDLSVEEPTNFEFVINLKTARAVGLVIPQSALLRATAVIE